MDVENHYGNVYVKQLDYANSFKPVSWKNAVKIPFSKYQIKETDMRIKTASFTSPIYFDLTTGQYAIRIKSKYHENFAGIILEVDYEEKTGMYTYQCQDFSRRYISKFESYFVNWQIYDILMFLILQGEVKQIKKKTKASGLKLSSSEKKEYKGVLSGLRTLNQYNQSLYTGNIFKGNSFKQKTSLIFRDATYIDVIRDVVWGQKGYYDVWFNEKGVLQIEPISKTDWESTGLHLVYGEYMDRKFKFSTTNAITRVSVNGTKTTMGQRIQSSELIDLPLATFFGRIGTSMNDPTQQNTTKTKGVSTSTTATVSGENPYGTKNKEIWINSDTVHGYSTDLKFMKDFASILEKNGWKTHIYERAYSEAHYQHIAGYSWGNKVKNGIWFTIYGGACAGTLRETATSSWFRKSLVNNGSRTVVGFIPPCGDIRKGKKYGDYLPRAWDDGFSGSNPGISNPQDFLTKYAIPFMYGKNATELANKFFKGGDNPEACNKNWKFVGN